MLREWFDAAGEFNAARLVWLSDWSLWLLALVALVLIVALVNLATLFRIRALARGDELAVRQALGAGRGRRRGEPDAQAILAGQIRS